MVNNYKCINCKHSLVCEFKKIVDKFHENEKKDLGIDITMDECKNFDEEE